ncbi:MAG: LysR family transcriptional regulator [Lachnospiraceae bacterium]|nr:LysR family transcriptional regulator [Lachnospiraceae bacterium]
MENQTSLSHYQIFNKVAETGNISLAAKELFISQPAISKAVKKLEADLAVSLFSRSSRGVRLTEEGKLLYEYTREAFRTLHAGESALRQFSRLGVGHVRIGVSTTLCKYLLLPFLKEFVAKHPHIRFTIQCQSSFQTMELLREGRVDIGLVGRSENMHSLNFLPTGQVEDVFVTTGAYLENMTLREGRLPQGEELLYTGNLMLLDEKNITRLYIDNYLASHHIRTGQILEVGSMDLLIEFARTGLGIACAIKEFIREDLESGHLFILPLSYPVPKREVGFCFAKSHCLPGAAQRFLDFILEADHTGAQTKGDSICC